MPAIFMYIITSHEGKLGILLMNVKFVSLNKMLSVAGAKLQSLQTSELWQMDVTHVNFFQRNPNFMWWLILPTKEPPNQSIPAFPQIQHRLLRRKKKETNNNPNKVIRTTS